MLCRWVSMRFSHSFSRLCFFFSGLFFYSLFVLTWQEKKMKIKLKSNDDHRYRIYCSSKCKDHIVIMPNNRVAIIQCNSNSTHTCAHKNENWVNIHCLADTFFGQANKEPCFACDYVEPFFFCVRVCFEYIFPLIDNWSLKLSSRRKMMMNRNWVINQEKK